MSKKHRIRIELKADETVGKLLREIADAMDGAAGREEFKGLGPEWHELKVKSETRKGRRRLEIKIKSEHHHHHHRKDDQQDQKKFKALKKKMGRSFAALVKCADRGEVPDPEILKAFLAAASAMTAIPGLGDPAYPEFQAACARLADAAAHAGPAATAKAVKDLAAIKKSCHAQFK